MNRWLPIPLLVFLFSGSLAHAQREESPEPRRSPTPAWLPRGALLGTLIRNDAVVGQVRAQWQLTLFQDRKDALVLLVEGGLGRSVSVPAVVQDTQVPLRYLTLHTAMVGGGYRNQNPGGLHWGFQVAAGPMFYAGRYTGVADEDRVAGLLEGRVHVGHAVGPVVAGVAVGYAEPFSLARRSLARPYVGGLLVGLFMDWR
jgi:hypothetical protein